MTFPKNLHLLASLLFSILMHFSLFLLIFEAISKHSQRLSQTQPPQTFEVQLSPQAHFNHQQKSKQAQTSRPLGFLKPLYSIYSRDQNTAEAPSATPSTSQAGSEFQSYGHPMDFKKENETYSFYKEIYQRVDHHLHFPTAAEWGRQSSSSMSMQLDLCFDEQGKFLRSKSLSTLAPQPLKKFLSHLLIRAFDQPLSPQKRPHGSSSLATCAHTHFTFEITEHNNAQLVQAQQWTLGNELFFYRHLHQSFAQWNLGPLHGMGPLIGLDLLWIPRTLQELTSKKAKPPEASEQELEEPIKTFDPATRLMPLPNNQPK
jgi:hypothetical protein